VRGGAVTVSDRVDSRLEPGVRHALIGPNRAGKTTFVNLITGRLAPSSGQVLLGGEDVTRLPQAVRGDPPAAGDENGRDMRRNGPTG